MAAHDSGVLRLPVQAREDRTFLERMWRLENTERPGFMFGYVGPKVRGGTPIRSALFSVEGNGTVRERLQDPEMFLEAQIEELAATALLPGDVVLSLCPAFGVVSIPSAFGSEVVWWEDNLPAVHPACDGEPGSVEALEVPDLTRGEVPRILATTRHFIERTGGTCPIRLTDVQGPLDASTLIAGHTEFLALMKTDPEVAHRLLRKVTDFIIAVVKGQRDLARSYGVEFVPSMFQPWLPDGYGVSVANDECVMLSSDMHDTFSVPYVNMLSEEFGGVFMHSCGDWTHQFSSLEKVHNLRGLEFGATEAHYEKVLGHFGGRKVLACRVGLHRDMQFDGMMDYVGRILQSARTYRGLFINVDVTNGIVDDTWPETDIQAIVRRITSPPSKDNA
jgi:hypothetical protein